MKVLYLEGDNIKDIESFYTEIDRVLTKDLNWKTGHNLDALNDILRGGFGVFEYEEPIKLIWNNINKNIFELGESFDSIIETIQEHKHISFIRN